MWLLIISFLLLISGSLATAQQIMLGAIPTLTEAPVANRVSEFRCASGTTTSTFPYSRATDAMSLGVSRATNPASSTNGRTTKYYPHRFYNTYGTTTVFASLPTVCSRQPLTEYPIKPGVAWQYYGGDPGGFRVVYVATPAETPTAAILCGMVAHPSSRYNPELRACTEWS